MRPPELRWEGGYIHVQKDGKRLFIIEKERGGDRFHISTRCHTPSAAYEHWKRFQADPWGYQLEMKEGREPDDGLFLTKQIVLEYRKWMLHRDQPASRKHANEMAHRLSEWVIALDGKDLRKLQLGDLKGALNRWEGGRQHRIIAIKGFFTWLRTEKYDDKGRAVLARRDDPTLDLEVPQAIPEKHVRRKAVEFERVRAALPYLKPAYQDLLMFASATGWHMTEIGRFVRRDDCEIEYRKRETTIAVLVTWHKTRKWVRKPITNKHVLSVAERLKARGTLPRHANDALKAACRKAKVAEFTFGVMRHSVGTWGVENGATEEQIQKLFDHADGKTTRKFYLDVAVPTTELKLPVLRLVKSAKKKAG